MAITHSASLVLLFVLVIKTTDGAQAGRLGPFIPGDGVALLHREFHLRCDNLDLTLDRGNVEYLWYRNSSLINNNFSSLLLFPNVIDANQSDYTCRVKDVESGILSPRSHTVTLRTYSSKIRRPQIRPVGTAVVNQAFILVCDMADSYTSSRNVTFTWYKEGTQVLVQFIPVLHFSRVREEDEGVYTCAIKDGGDSSPPSEAFLLTPLVSPEVHIGLKPPHNVIRGILGENLTLTCEVIRAFPRVPADGYSWSYLPSPEGRRRPLVGKASTLTLGPLTREDGGQYFCKARNDRHFRGLSLSGTIANVTVHIIYMQNMNLTPDLEVKEGDSVTLICAVDSHPAARIAWTVHGHKVRHVTGNLYHYVIPRANCSDSTSYTCRASNTDLPGREISKSTRVRVQSCSTGGDSSQRDCQTWMTVAGGALGILVPMVVIVVVFLLVLCRRRVPVRCHICARYLVCVDADDTRDIELQERRSLLQEGVEEFEARYRRGQVHVIPPLPAQQLPLEDVQAELRTLGRVDARVYVLRLLLRDLLEAHTHPGDPPVFVFTRDLPPNLHAAIFHSRWGVILVKTEAVSSSDSLSSTLMEAARQLSEGRGRVEAELRDLLEPKAVSLLLALPYVKNRGELGDSLRGQLVELDVQPLCGRKIDLDTRQQFPFWVERPVWRSEPDRHQAFVTAVKKRLSACRAAATARQMEDTSV